MRDITRILMFKHNNQIFYKAMQIDVLEKNNH